MCLVSPRNTSPSSILFGKRCPQAGMPVATLPVVLLSLNLYTAGNIGPSLLAVPYFQMVNYQSNPDTFFLIQKRVAPCLESTHARSGIWLSQRIAGCMDPSLRADVAWQEEKIANTILGAVSSLNHFQPLGHAGRLGRFPRRNISESASVWHPKTQKRKFGPAFVEHLHAHQPLFG